MRMQKREKKIVYNMQKMVTQEKITILRQH
jgi:hypothetical protein